MILTVKTKSPWGDVLYSDPKIIKVEKDTFKVQYFPVSDFTIDDDPKVRRFVSSESAVIDLPRSMYEEFSQSLVNSGQEDVVLDLQRPYSEYF